MKDRTALVTSLPVGKADVAEIIACGRARGKIENESFNVLENFGCEFEHDFGHGENYLAMTLAALNMPAFAWRTGLDLVEPPWRRARKAAEKRTSFFAYVAALTTFTVFPSWSDLLEALAASSPAKKRMRTVLRGAFRIVRALAAFDRAVEAC